MTDQFDVELEDGDLLAEIELLTQLIIATLPFDQHLSTSQVDIALGLRTSSGPDAVDARPASATAERP